MKINASMTGVVIPGLVAGVIYFVIALATGASAAASIIGGVLVAAIAVAIGFIFRAVYKRRAAGPNE
jgi:predicted lipid-binding transport protein (Tim44 family)